MLEGPNTRVLVNCWAGISRSATIATAFLVSWPLTMIWVMSDTDMFVTDAAQGHEAGPGPQANQVSQKCVAEFRIFKRVGSFGNRFNIEINISQFSRLILYKHLLIMIMIETMIWDCSSESSSSCSSDFCCSLFCKTLFPRRGSILGSLGCNLLPAVGARSQTELGPPVRVSEIRFEKIPLLRHFLTQWMKSRGFVQYKVIK